MKKFFTLFAITFVLVINGFAQKKPGTAKAPAKKTPPASSAYKSGPIDETTFFATVEHNGEKTEIKYSQYESHGGTASYEGGGRNRFTFTYGAGNSQKNNDSIFFSGMIPTAAKGTYELGGSNQDTSFIFTAPEFPNVPVFLVKSGSYTITAAPLTGGFVEGTFSMICENVTNDGQTETYNISGSFKVLRMS